MESKKEGEGQLKLSHTHNEEVSRPRFWHNPVYVMQQDCNTSKTEGRQAIKKK